MLELKTQNKKQAKRIDQLEKKVSVLQNSHSTSKNPKEMSIKSYDEQKRSKELRKYSQKRPARLLPYERLFFNKNKTDAEPAIPKFYGPPHNCSELSKLGYTLNGFYQVKVHVSNSSNANDFTQLETIYCAFKQPERVFDETKLESRIVPKIAKVTGIPTSCNDLQQRGHSLNGLYLIKKNDPNIKGTKIQTVYCNFQSSTSSDGMLKSNFLKVSYKVRNKFFRLISKVNSIPFIFAIFAV